MHVAEGHVSVAAVGPQSEQSRLPSFLCPGLEISSLDVVGGSVPVGEGVPGRRHELLAVPRRGESLQGWDRCRP